MYINTENTKYVELTDIEPDVEFIDLHNYDANEFNLKYKNFFDKLKKLKIIEISSNDKFTIPDFIYGQTNLQVLKINSPHIYWDFRLYNLTELNTLIILGNIDIFNFDENIKKLINLQTLTFSPRKNFTAGSLEILSLLPALINISFDLSNYNKLLEHFFQNIFFYNTPYLKSDCKISNGTDILNIDYAHVQSNNYLNINCNVFETIGKREIIIPDTITNLILVMPSVQTLNNIPNSVKHLKVTLCKIIPMTNLPVNLKNLDLLVIGEYTDSTDFLQKIKLPFDCKLKIYSEMSLIPNRRLKIYNAKIESKYHCYKLIYNN
jgi:hypothetical protein